MSAQKNLDQGLERIDGNVNGLFAKVWDLVDRVEEFEQENEELREQLEQTENLAKTAYSLAGQTDDGARADGGPSKKTIAQLLSRNECVRRALVETGKGGGVTAPEVNQMGRGRDTNLHYQTIRDAWETLENEWECFRIQESDDRESRLVVNRDDLEEDLVRVVDDDLGRYDLTKRLLGEVS